MNKENLIEKKKYKLLHEWMGGEYTLHEGAEVWFIKGEESYMCFHEGRVRVINQIFENDIPSAYWFEEIKKYKHEAIR